MKTQSANMFVSLMLLLLPVVLAHTWVEQLSLIAPNGTFVGTPGYSRGYMSREQAGFEDDMVYLLPPDGRANELLPTDTICKSTQTIGNQTNGFPALVASPGDNIALRYQENGHVTLPNTQIGKPANRGTVFIYGTTQPSNSDTILDIHKVWNANGTGGDGRGVLLATRNFDDGQCYQVNGGNISVARQAEFADVKTTTALMGVNLWCQTSVQLPSNITGDSYSLYWVWDWPTAPNVTGSGEPNGKIEIYTSCMDIAMEAATSNSQEKFEGASAFVAGQTIDYAAVQEQLANQFQVTEGTSTASPSATSSLPSSTAQAPAQSTTRVAQPSASSAVTRASSAAGGGVTITVTDMVTVTQAQAPAVTTVTVGASSVVTQYSTITVNGNAASVSQAAPSPATSSKSVTVTPFSLPPQSTVTTVIVSSVSSSTLTVQTEAAPTETAGFNSTTPSRRMLRSHVRRHLY